MTDARTQILVGARQAGKTFAYAAQDPTVPAHYWFQRSHEGLILFAVFYTLACRWNRCAGCNLASRSSLDPIGYRDVIAQVDHLFGDPELTRQAPAIRKVVLSNNGSLLDEVTFPSTALMYLLATLNLKLPQLALVSLESRVEYVDLAELELISRALRERDVPAQLELAVGLEAFDDAIRNTHFHKGLHREQLEQLTVKLGQYGHALKCYLMLKPVPGMDDAAAVADCWRAIEWLDELARRHGARINLHLNPTYVAAGTPLEEAFRRGDYAPPRLRDAARAARHARGRQLSVFLGLWDEGLAVAGGSFVHPGEEGLRDRLEEFNRTQDFDLLDGALGADVD